MNKKIIWIVLILTLVALLFCSCNPQEATFHALKYTANEGGSIEGETEQSVECGKDGEAVTAVPNEGYEFVKWSDDVETATRQDKNVQRDLSVIAEFRLINDENKSYTLTYLVEEGGWLEGKTVQTITEEIYGTDVIVHVQDGYEFIGWSDGKKEYQRRDYHDHQDKTITAQIRRKDYKLQNWYTEFGVGVPTVTINNDTVDTLSFPIPTREHFTFEGWYLGDTLVGDEQGKSYFTKELLEDGNRDIVAKWTANETFTYKILLVYVTRIDATLPTVDNTSTIHVDYTMSELEREFYRLTTIRLKEYLDNIMDGLVDFQVDEYYTTQTIKTENFIRIQKDNILHANQIPEALNMLTRYDSALSVVSLNDENRKLYTPNGSANARYGERYADTFLRYGNLDKHIATLKSNEYSLFGDNNLYQAWFRTFIHELAHTIEQRIHAYEYHDCIYNGMKTLTDQYKQKMYYLNEIERDDSEVGIPYEFWAGNILKVRYDAQEIGVGYGGGYIRGEGYYSKDTAGAVHCIYDVPCGYNVPTVTAVAHEGYEFVEWSDGVKTATRTDTNITEDKTITAIFKPSTYQLTVTAGEGGRIVRGEGTFELQTDGKNVLLEAQANEGYVFVGWSDGDINIDRSFKVNATTKRLFDENRQYTLTALFNKIGEEPNYYILNFTQSEGGRYLIYGGLKNDESILMEKDNDTLNVIVSTDTGYRFVRWSDGSTEQERTFIINNDLIALSDENNTITVYAIFEKIE